MMPAAMLETDAAIEAVRAVLAERGHAIDPVVLADRSNLVLGLEVGGAKVVARVAMVTSLVRVGMAWLRREVEIARFLDARSVRVTRPSTSIEAGPIERNGFVMSFWEREALREEPADPADAGAVLAAAHRALVDYPPADLPTWGALAEAREAFVRARGNGVFDATERARLEAAWDRAERIADSARGRTASWQAVHGDAHLGNVLATTRGAVWSDWEDAFVGPVEWDLATVRSRAELFGEERARIDVLMRAYDVTYDAELASDLGLARNVQVVSWLAVFAERQPEVLPRMRARLEKLSDQMTSRP